MNNITILAAVWLVSAGFGTWVTFFSQPSELEELRQTEQYARVQQTEVTALLAEQAQMEGKAAAVQAQWDSRYKTIPRRLKTHEVIAYLNSLTRSGFESFDVTYSEDLSGKDFNTHVFTVSGRGDFGALYDFIWSIENYRAFYRITDFELSHIDLPSVDRVTGRERLQVAVSFDFKIHAYYGGKAGLSADDQLAVAGSVPEARLPSNELPPVPAEVLPARQPAKNPFYPVIMTTIPPNTEGLLELDKATLISIVDSKAIFESSIKDPKDGSTIKTIEELSVGDDVYLGRIIMVDPINNRVVARLNIGGIMDERIFELETTPNFRQALGPSQLAPSN